MSEPPSKRKRIQSTMKFFLAKPVADRSSSVNVEPTANVTDPATADSECSGTMGPQMSPKTAEEATQISVDAVHLDRSAEQLLSDKYSNSVMAELQIYDRPYQPSSTVEFPQQEIVRNKSKKFLTFQTSWFRRFPWLHFSTDLKAVLCFHCAKANSLSLLSLCTQNETTFICKGFTNWNKAIQKFKTHETSACHRHAYSQLQQLQSPNVVEHLSTQKAADQVAARSSLITVLRAVQFLARQGLALRGHNDDDGNLRQLLQMMAAKNVQLDMWMQRTTKLLSHDCQNEMLQLMSADIVRKIVNKVKDESVHFAIVVDGTQDYAGQEQESICIRYVDSKLEVREKFVGLYNPPDTSGKTLSMVVKDVLLRLSLPIANLRAQTYDGAANMKGQYNGCQSHISREQPLAFFVHCSAHCANLVAEQTANCNSFIRDGISVVQELSNLNSRSVKFKQLFAETLTHKKAYKTLKPLCPTRWLCRVSAVLSAVTQYEAVLNTLEQMSKLPGETGTKCNGLLDKLRKGTTLLALKIVICVLSRLEQLNCSLQGEKATLGGMVKAVQYTNSELSRMRSEDEFRLILSDVSATVEHLDLDPVVIPRTRRPPGRFCGPSVSHVAQSAEEHYRSIYYQVIDCAVNQMNDRFDMNSSGLRAYLQLESALLSGDVGDRFTTQYPELDVDALAVQLKMFRNSHCYESLHEAQQTFQSMCPEVRQLFPQVEQLLRLQLLFPVTSCSAERSFSSLRRLKNWLRTTMLQARLNAVALCNIHQDLLDDISIEKVAKDFASSSEIRRGIFGNWPDITLD